MSESHNRKAEQAEAVCYPLSATGKRRWLSHYLIMLLMLIALSAAVFLGIWYLVDDTFYHDRANLVRTGWILGPLYAAALVWFLLMWRNRIKNSTVILEDGHLIVPPLKTLVRLIPRQRIPLHTIMEIRYLEHERLMGLYTPDTHAFFDSDIARFHELRAHIETAMAVKVEDGLLNVDEAKELETAVYPAIEQDDEWPYTVIYRGGYLTVPPIHAYRRYLSGVKIHLRDVTKITLVTDKPLVVLSCTSHGVVVFSRKIENFEDLLEKIKRSTGLIPIEGMVYLSDV